MTTDLSLSSFVQSVPDRLPWHKPEVQQIQVTLDTAGISGSNVDGQGGNLFPSDARLKEDIAGVANGLARLLALHAANEGNQAELVTLLVEAIKQQQAMIEDLRTQVGSSR